MAKKETNEVSVDSKYLEFTLVLPQAIDIKPNWVVDMPRNKEARVFSVTRAESIGRDSVPTSRLNYDVYIVNKKTGATVSITTGHYFTGNGRAVTFTDLPSVRQFIIDTSVMLSRKRVIRKQTNVVDVNDDEDE